MIDLVPGTFNSVGLWFVYRLWSDVVLVAWIKFFVSLCALDQRNDAPLIESQHGWFDRLLQPAFPPLLLNPDHNLHFFGASALVLGL